ncbi:uncharacterized protein PV09_06717 [Verruconis gallopava]|uniref:Uncharacterized protein n=1 Tax=Verruconis gallopava TaxID=253628 RepID=A0A0D2A526_9PEZI|nr:uncharacterized protein PV09_06717 [Verruconis gallopava]KIW01868.1 hypothetical protein PV09_06717 [Verruconis gallopava]
MAQITPGARLDGGNVLRRDFVSLLGAGQSFFSSLFSPAIATKAHGDPADSNTTPAPAPASIPTPAGNAPTVVSQTEPAVQTTQQTDQTAAPTTQATEATSMPDETPTITDVASTPVTLVTATSSTRDASSAELGNTQLVSSTPVLENTSPTSTVLSPISTSSPNVASTTVSHKHPSNAGLIAAVTTVVLLLLISIAALAYFYVRRRRRRKAALEHVESKTIDRRASSTTISSVDQAESSIERAEAVSLPLYTPSKANLVIPPARARLRELGFIRPDSVVSRDSRTSRAASWRDSSPQPRYGPLQSPAPDSACRHGSKVGAELEQFNSLVLPPSLVAGQRPASGAAAPNRSSVYELWFQPLNRPRPPSDPGPTQGAGVSRSPALKTPVEDGRWLTRKPVPAQLDPATDA